MNARANTVIHAHLLKVVPFGPFPGIPQETDLPQRRRKSSGVPLLRQRPRRCVGRKKYSAVVDLRMSDGRTLIGYPVVRNAPTSRFQARKLLKKCRQYLPAAYLMVTQRIL
jgi:hypothetical protein